MSAVLSLKRSNSAVRYCFEADAEPGVPDLHRPLTPKGQKQAKRVARWLHAR